MPPRDSSAVLALLDSIGVATGADARQTATGAETSPRAEAFARAMSPEAKARGVTTAAELLAAVEASERDAVPHVPTVAKLPEAPQAAGEDIERGAPDREAITREDCERAARQGKWIGLATPSAWAAALERDEERHACALGLLKRETWGLYERQRIQDRDIAELWRAVTRLAEALRRGMRGDSKQAALFGLLVESEDPTDAK